MLQRYFLMYTFIVSLLLSSSSSFAHTTETNKAQFTLHDDNSYQISLSVDAIHLLKSHINSEEDDQVIIEQLQKLSLSKLRMVLDEVEQAILSGLVVTINTKAPESSVIAITPPNITGVNLKVLRDVLQSKYGKHHGNFTISAQGKLPENSENLSLAFPQLLGKIQLDYQYQHKMLVLENQHSALITVAPENSSLAVSDFVKQVAVFVEYIVQGYLHILPMGVDHILFVLALFLIATKVSTLLWQVSAFTLAHTITLALGIYGVVSIPASIVEPLIALSIAYVAVENIFKPTMSKWRLPLIFAFGLLHGLGFASVLLELGLAPEQYLLSLVAFNIGVEIGQLSVILVAFVCLGWWLKHHWYRNRVVKPMSAAIAVVGIYWFIERLL